MEYIDLGLPSGTLWAAENETDNGGYFTYDEAVAKFGDNLPTKADFEELLKHCRYRRKKRPRGAEFTSKTNGLKLFLLPFGIRYGSGFIEGMKLFGGYWSATPYIQGRSYCFLFSSIACSICDDICSCERTVRLVKHV